MLTIRLKRTGRKNDPSFKIVVGEKFYSPKSGKHYEYLGSYNPKTKATIIDEAGVKAWIAKGAQPSDTLTNLFITKGIIQGKKVNVLPAYKAPEVKEEPKAEEPAPAAEVPAEQSATEPAS